MKSQALKLLLCLLLINFGAPVYYSQVAEEKNAQNTEVLGENERIPFMQTEQSAGTADSGSGSLLLRTLGAMLVIVGIIFCGAWGLKKFGFGASQTVDANAPDLAILSSVSPGSGRTLSVVRFGDRTLLIGSTAQSFTLLADESGEKTTVSPQARSVADLLAAENSTFDKELSRAQAVYDLREENGGQI